MHRIIFLALVFLFSQAAVAVADYKIAVVQSSRIKPYEEALHGFCDFCQSRIPPRGVKSILPGTIEVFVLSDLDNDSIIATKLRRHQPDLILAIGLKALRRVNSVSDRPLIYCMIPPDHQFPGSLLGTTGVKMAVPMAVQLEKLLATFPDVQRIGMMFDPKRSAALATEAERAARTKGITLIAEAIHSSEDFHTAILSLLEGGIDAFWLIPDLTVITPELDRSMYYLSVDEEIPVLAFADKYLQHGATMSVSFDVYDMGRQAGEMAWRLLAGSEVHEIHADSARRATVKLSSVISR